MNWGVLWSVLAIWAIMVVMFGALVWWRRKRGAAPEAGSFNLDRPERAGPKRINPKTGFPFS